MMKNQLFLSLATTFLMAVPAVADTGKATVSIPADGMTCEIEFYTPDIVRVVKYPSAMTSAPEKKSLAVIASPADVNYSRKDNSGAVTLKTGKLTVSVNKKTGDITFSDARGRKLLREGDAVMTMRESGADKGSYTVVQNFSLDKDEPIYGLGILQNGKMSQRGTECKMIQGNTWDFVPFFQSLKGYGVYWDNYSPTWFRDNASTTMFDSEVGDCIDYYFMGGGNADGVVANMRHLTGDVPMHPMWTYGFWQSRERYKTQEELLEVVRRHRELGVPLDGIIQDWQYWGNNYQWNAMEFVNSGFHDPKAMMDEVHARNAHAIISVWSSFGPMTKPYREMDAKGLLFGINTWPESGYDGWPPRKDYPAGVKVYDAFSAEARDIYWNHLKRLYDLGLDGWWMDSTEPDHFDFKEEDLELPTALGSFRKVRNAYPLMSVEGVYDHQRAIDNDRRVFILTRSAFAGQQRTGANTWSGDVVSTWDSFRAQLPAGLNFSLTGNPNYNSDLGGFFPAAYNNVYGDNSAPKNPLFQELYVRWLQYGIFSPMMRSHGENIKREIYYFGEAGEPVYDAIAEAIKLRYALLPYTYSTAHDVSARRGSFLRALSMDFPADRNTHDCNDKFMYGRSLLVAPVLHAAYTPEDAISANKWLGLDNGTDNSAKIKAAVNFNDVKEHSVYLPAGTAWWDYFTGEKLQGGKTHSRPVKLNSIPLYVKAGSILPIGPDVQYATEKPWDNLEVRVYPGADGEFTLYEDEGDNYNYEKGMFSTITFAYDDSARKLTIGDRSGSFPGMIGKRKFRIVLPDGKSATVDYDGRKQTVKL